MYLLLYSGDVTGRSQSLLPWLLTGSYAFTQTKNVMVSNRMSYDKKCTITCDFSKGDYLSDRKRKDKTKQEISNFMFKTY